MQTFCSSSHGRFSYNRCRISSMFRILHYNQNAFPLTITKRISHNFTAVNSWNLKIHIQSLIKLVGSLTFISKDLKEEIKYSFENVEQVLSRVGSSWEDVQAS
ncbi:hypothetical protein BDF20DRAFT_833514 [Mycotypha africana]|uniref:uncharacterized protein n=1 Tax=Mycotypha africana TaxID=64632 RepID=UPI0023011F40|nr:uncharacterized protein BDF20DRAFT_833514 [Mycotypha africana]KAI8983962.1 hypothetical protein BDF20DRAFT_833514 [Mycotypha africana]